jgi:hypothetical protein
MNKTGTTSLAKFMELNDFACGDQAKGELLLKSYIRGDYTPLTSHCQTADFFQDIPFSIPGCHTILLKAFPSAKFILTIRKSAEHWYNSLVNFHEKVFGKPLNKERLMQVDYRYKGFAWEANRALYDSPDSDPYNKKALIDAYEKHIQQVKRDFTGSKKLLILEIESDEAVNQLSNFLEIETNLSKMPWLNKTVDA